jgi:hypothetical protein
MNIQIAVLCDAAVDYGGRLSLLGTFDAIVARQFPTVHPHFTVALRLAFEKSEEGSHNLRVDFVDEDGHPVMLGVEIALRVQVPDDALAISQNLILNLQNVRVNRAGHYAFAVLIDGRLAASIPLQVKLPSEPAQI